MNMTETHIPMQRLSSFASGQQKPAEYMATDTDKFQSSGQIESAHEFEFVALYIWLIIDKIEDVVVGSSIPYNYDKSRF